MSRTFKAYRIEQTAGQIKGVLSEMNWTELSPHEVIIEGQYSSVNFKDALAATGAGKILKRFPLIGGIDVAGTVVSSKSPQFRVGDSVLVTGCNLGESEDGGYSQFISAPAASVVAIPSGLSSADAMLIGTAGFTAALCLYRMEQNGQQPQKGPILITGASGGVGSIAVDIFSQQDYEVWAVSGKKDQQTFLSELGARKVLSPEALEFGRRPLEQARFAGAVDNVGGEMLAGILRHIDLWGNVASVGLAGGSDLNTTVMPFILRGVSILGISSNNTPRPLREELWKRLAGIWRPKHLKRIHFETIGLHELDAAFQKVLKRQVCGRILVDLKKGF